MNPIVILILDSLCFILAVISLHFSLRLFQLLGRHSLMRWFVFAMVYAVVARFLYVTNDLDLPGVERAILTSMMSPFWLLLVIGMISLYITVKRAIKK